MTMTERTYGKKARHSLVARSLSENDNPPRLWGFVALGAYVACIVGANIAITVFGVVRLWPLHLMAPAGVFLAGCSFTARDWLQETLGRRWTVIAICIGALLSALLSPALALASGTAFLVSEGMDFGVYSKIRERSLTWAMVLSNTVGSVVDSALFLYLAFGSLAFFWGNVVGKEATVLPALLVLWAVRWRRARRQATWDAVSAMTPDELSAWIREPITESNRMQEQPPPSNPAILNTGDAVAMRPHISKTGTLLDKHTTKRPQ